MKIRIEAETQAELDVAEALVRLVFDAGPASRDYRNRRRDQGEQRVPGWRRYVNDNVKPFADISVWAVQFGNYDPPEISSMHLSEALAEAEVDRLNKTTGFHGHQVSEHVISVDALVAALRAGEKA